MSATTGVAPRAIASSSEIDVESERAHDTATAAEARSAGSSPCGTRPTKRTHSDTPRFLASFSSRVRSRPSPAMVTASRGTRARTAGSASTRQATS
jgi:hypothetical protein